MEKNFPRITLKAARVNANYTQKTAAKKLNINVRTLQKYETGDVIPQWDTVLDMSELYGISADYFLLHRKTAISGEMVS